MSKTSTMVIRVGVSEFQNFFTLKKQKIDDGVSNGVSEFGAVGVVGVYPYPHNNDGHIHLSFSYVS